MTVSVGTARVQYNGSGSTGPFAFNFKLFDASHVKVVKTDADEVDTTLTLNSGYTVALAADFSSAEITTAVDVESGEKLTLTRDPPISQLVAWPRSDPFPAATHERAADLAVMLIDRLNEKIGRSILLPESATVSGLELPAPSALAVLRWNAAADALENVAVGDFGLLAVSSFAETLLDDASAAEARTTLGALAASLVSAFSLTLLDDADDVAARTTLGVAYASDAQVRSAATGVVIPASALESTPAFGTLTDAATVAVDWDAFINANLTITANRALGNPTNGQPGTFRQIYVIGSSVVPRTLTFGGQFLGDVPTLTDITDTKAYLLTIFCKTTTHFVVSSKRALG